MESLKDTTTGKDLYNTVVNCLSRSNLSLEKLASVKTDGVPALISKHSGLIRLLNNKIEDFPLYKVLPFHCNIHQENLCKSSLKIKHIVDPIIHAVNSIRLHGLKHRQF